MDEMLLVYNINLCRICQVPGQLDLIETDTTIEDGGTYLELLKFIFEDICWVEDELISLACKTCLEKVTDTAQFKRLCLDTNGRRGDLRFDPLKVELVAIKVEEDQAVTEQADDEPETEAAQQKRAKRKLSSSDEDRSEDLKPLKTNQKAKRKKTDNASVKAKVTNTIKRRRRKPKTQKKSEETDENIDNKNTTDSNKEKPLLYGPEYEPSDHETKCRICKKEFDDLDDLKDHISIDHLKLRSFICDICHEGFSGLDLLYRHIFRHNGSRNYICTVCGKKYITYGDLCRHKKLHEENFKYVCDICPDKKFKSASNLGMHKVIVHTDPKDYKHICTECGVKFPALNSLKEHMLRHNNIRNFPCNMCDKWFITKGEMLRHTGTHSNMRPFKCDLCPAEFKRRNIMVVHKSKRHGIGTYKRTVIEYDCNYCDKKIKSKDKLQRHMRTHTGLKPYSCRLCNQKFICKSYIKGHVRTKHDVDVDAPDYKTSLYYDVRDEEVSKDDVTGDVKAEPTDGASS